MTLRSIIPDLSDKCSFTTIFLSQVTRLFRDGRFGSKVGQIVPKWNKSGAFSDQISMHLANLTDFGAKPTIPACNCVVGHGDKNSLGT